MLIPLLQVKLWYVFKKLSYHSPCVNLQWPSWLSLVWSHQVQWLVDLLRHWSGWTQSMAPIAGGSTEAHWLHKTSLSLYYCWHFSLLLSNNIFYLKEYLYHPLPRTFITLHTHRTRKHTHMCIMFVHYGLHAFCAVRQRM